MRDTTWPVGSVYKKIIYLESKIPSFVLTVQLLRRLKIVYFQALLLLRGFQADNCDFSNSTLVRGPFLSEIRDCVEN